MAQQYIIKALSLKVRSKGTFLTFDNEIYELQLDSYQSWNLRTLPNIFLFLKKKKRKISPCRGEKPLESSLLHFLLSQDTVNIFPQLSPFPAPHTRHIERNQKTKQNKTMQVVPHILLDESQIWEFGWVLDSQIIFSKADPESYL